MREHTRPMMMGAAAGRAGRFAAALALLAVMALAAVTAGSPGTALGASWVPMDSGTLEDLVDVWGTSGSNVYALAAGGALLHYDGKGWSRMDDGPLAGVAAEHRPHAHSIWGSSATDLWVVAGAGGPEGGAHSVFRRSGGGWTASTSGPGETCFQDLWGTSASNAVLVKADGLILRYNGAEWTGMASGSTASLRGVWGSSASSYYAVGDGGTILQWNGSAWTAMASGSTASLRGVWGSSASDVFAVGSDPAGSGGGVILHRSGGQWGPMDIGATPALLGIWGGSASDVFAVGEGGAILHFDGSAWSPWASGTIRKLNAIWGSSSAGFFAVGDGGTILYYYDSPETPVNISPADNATTDNLTPVLQASPYADADGDAHAASRWQIRSEGGGYISPVWDSGSRAVATRIAVPEGKLAGSTRYYWRVGYQQAGGRWSGYSAETSFTTLAVAKVPPEVADVAAESIGSTSATLRLSLTTLGSAASVQVSFQWGLTAACDNSSAPQVMTGTGSYSVTLYELSPAATYYFRAVAVGDGTRQSVDAVFTTGGKPPQVPEVASIEATGVGAGSATLRGDLRGLGSAAGVEISFEWGQTAAYGAITTPRMMNAPGPFSFDLTGLAAGTTYHFRARAMGDGDAGGGDMVFATPAGAAAVVAAGEAAGVTASTALLQGELTSLGGAGSVMVSFEWGTARGGPYPYQTAAAAREAPGSFESPLTGLAAGTAYYYRAKAMAGGVAAYGDEKSFTTIPAAPVIRGLAAGSGRPGDQLAVTISGANLGGATAVGFGAGIAVTEFAAGSAGEITARITIGRGAEAGRREVTVTTPGGTVSTPGLFAVDAAGPTEHLQVYLAAGAGGVAALGLLALLMVWLWRRPARRATGAS